MGLDAIESARPDGDARATGVVRPWDAQRRGIVMAKRAAKAIETKATEHTNLEGLAWLEAAESYARFTNDAVLALALLYLRGALTGDGGLTVALNLSEALRALSLDMGRTFDALAQRDFEAGAVRAAAKDEGERCAVLLASGWRWLARVAA